MMARTPEKGRPSKTKHEKSIKSTNPVENRVIDEEWFRDRLDATGFDREQQARMLQLSGANMVWRVYSGQRPMRMDEVARWATLLSTSPAEIARRQGFQWPRPTVPLVGSVMSRGRIVMRPPTEVVEVPAPEEIPGDLVAIVAETAHSAMAIFEGAHYFYRPSRVYNPRSGGKLSVIEAGDLPGPLLAFIDLRQPAPGRYTLIVGTEKIETEQIISATPIVWVRMG